MFLQLAAENPEIRLVQRCEPHPDRWLHLDELSPGCCHGSQKDGHDPDAPAAHVMTQVTTPDQAQPSPVLPGKELPVEEHWLIYDCVVSDRFRLLQAMGPQLLVGMQVLTNALRGLHLLRCKAGEEQEPFQLQDVFLYSQWSRGRVVRLAARDRTGSRSDPLPPGAARGWLTMPQSASNAGQGIRQGVCKARHKQTVAYGRY